MKFRLYSDVHNEHTNVDWEIPVLPEEDKQVLLLAGDIHEGTTYLDKMSELNKRFDSTVYCAGNHEMYDSTVEYVQAAFNYNSLGCLFELRYVDEDTFVVSTTLWSDVPEGFQPDIDMGMNDYHLTRYHDQSSGLLRTLRSKVTTALHKEVVSKLDRLFKEEIEENPDIKIVVVTHHAPSFKSVHPMYEGDIFNHAYATDLEWLILKYPQIKLWCHGHMHHNNDYMIGECRVVSNPRGYPSALNPDFKEDLILEI